jgi:hypothetical protein
LTLHCHRLSPHNIQSRQFFMTTFFVLELGFLQKGREEKGENHFSSRRLINHILFK